MKATGLKIGISDVEEQYCKVGKGKRCTLTFSFQDEEGRDLTFSAKNCMVFRSRKGKINFLTPCVFIGPAKVRHRPMVLSPDLANWLGHAMEQRYGPDITRFDGKGYKVETAKVLDSFDIEEYTPSAADFGV